MQLHKTSRSYWTALFNKINSNDMIQIPNKAFVSKYVMWNSNFEKFYNISLFYLHYWTASQQVHLWWVLSVPLVLKHFLLIRFVQRFGLRASVLESLCVLVVHYVCYSLMSLAGIQCLFSKGKHLPTLALIFSA